MKMDHNDASALGKLAFYDYMALDLNPFPQGSLGRVWWWNDFIKEAIAIRDDASEQWLIREARK